MANEKLVRDKIQSLSAAAGEGRVFRTAGDGEKAALLAAKVLEEARELAAEVEASPAAKAKVMEEMADCLEILLAVGEHFQISPEEVEAVRKKKAEAKGGFARWSVLKLGPKA